MKITVVLATYNGIAFLNEQLSSILNQSRKPDRIIITDDCSEDGTYEWLVQQKEKYKFDLIRTPENIGLIENFKFGINQDSSSYIALADQDDIWEESKLLECNRAMEEIKSEDVPCLVYSDLTVINEKGVTTSSSFWKATGRGNYEHNLETLFFGNFVSGCTTLMNPTLAAFAKDIPSRLKLNHDAWLSMVAFSMGTVKQLKKPLVRYRQHSSNVTYDNSKKKRTIWSKLRQHLYFLVHPKEYLADHFELVQAFYNCYKDHPQFDCHMDFESFLSIKNKSYIFQKIAMRRAFFSILDLGKLCACL